MRELDAATVHPDAPMRGIERCGSTRLGPRGPLALPRGPQGAACRSPPPHGVGSPLTVSAAILTPVTTIAKLASHLVLGALLDDLSKRYGDYEVVAHWVQGEFHHDIVLWLPQTACTSDLPGRVLIIATNCNGGVKEVLCFCEIPDRSALWHRRCPAIQDFSGELPPILERVTTEHWFDPCELLSPDARSELRPEFRRRQMGGGWEHVGPIPATVCTSPKP